MRLMMAGVDGYAITAYPRPTFRSIALTSLILYIVYKLVRLIVVTYRTRCRYRDIPSLPRHWLLGSLKVVAQKCSPQLNRHPDYGFEEIWNDLGQPPCFHVDLAPVDSHGFLVVAEPGVAEEIAQPSAEFKYSVPKADTMHALTKLIGKESLIVTEGEEWRELRKRFNRGFAPAHLHTLSPLVVAKMQVFISRIQDAARTGQVVCLKDFAQDLTTDIITQITMEKDFESQSIPEGSGPKSTIGLLTASRKLSQVAATTGQGFDPIGYFNIVRRFKELLYEWIFDRELYAIIQQKLEQERMQPKKQDTSQKAVAQLALADLEPTPALIRNTVHQIKTFLFAGQDTTATLIEWLCYELSKADYDERYRSIVTKLEDEHTRVFGPGAYSALDVLSQHGKADEFLGDKLPYTSAFIKETLRLHPPASSARLVPEISKTSPPFYVNINSQPTLINGLRIYSCQWLIHRNPNIWGEDAHVFNPDRWLDEEYMRRLPPGAWRPFERGPRNCIGQELAMMEAKLVLCAVTRGVRFEKVGLTGRDGEKEVWNTQNVTSVPIDGMRMRFSFKSGGEK